MNETNPIHGFWMFDDGTILPALLWADRENLVLEDWGDDDSPNIIPKCPCTVIHAVSGRLLFSGTIYNWSMSYWYETLDAVRDKIEQEIQSELHSIDDEMNYAINEARDNAEYDRSVVLERQQRMNDCIASLTEQNLHGGVVWI